MSTHKSGSVHPLVLLPCRLEPPHPRVYMEDNPDEYLPDCLYCSTDALAEAHYACEHKTHGRWRSWRVTRRLITRLYALGLVRGSTTTFGAWCKPCVTNISWGFGGPYLLGLPRNTWRCLLHGHRPGDPIAFGYCSKCLPCPSCGSKTAGHKPGCEDA